MYTCHFRSIKFNPLVWREDTLKSCYFWVCWVSCCVLIVWLYCTIPIQFFYTTTVNKTEIPLF